MTAKGYFCTIRDDFFGFRILSGCPDPVNNWNPGGVLGDHQGGTHQIFVWSPYHWILTLAWESYGRLPSPNSDECSVRYCLRSCQCSVNVDWFRNMYFLLKCTIVFMRKVLNYNICKYKCKTLLKSKFPGQHNLTDIIGLVATDYCCMTSWELLTKQLTMAPSNSWGQNILGRFSLCLAANDLSLSRIILFLGSSFLNQ